MRDPEVIRHEARIVNVFGSTAAGLLGRVVRVIPQVQCHTYNVQALSHETRSGHGGVDSTGHRDQDSLWRRHFDPIIVPRPPVRDRSDADKVGRAMETQPAPSDMR